MSKCTFTEDTSAGVTGTTAYAEGKDACFKDTGVYFSPAHSFANAKVNVILWMHGYYVHSARDLFRPKKASHDMKLRESVLDAQKDLVLVAPWLGLKESSDTGRLALDELGKGDGCQTYLNEVLDGLGHLQKALANKQGKPAAAKLELGNLIVAGHSAGGGRMRDAVRHLGGIGSGQAPDKGTLRECWGFDCQYDSEKTWGAWAREFPSVKKYSYIGNGSFGWDSFGFMKHVHGTPTKPVAATARIPNMFLAPAISGHLTAIDRIAFQTVEDIQKKAPKDWQVAGLNWYETVRKKTDVYLDEAKYNKYWGEIWAKLKEHFHVVIDLFGPRIKQSAFL
jgi:hypothetical protein